MMLRFGRARGLGGAAPGERNCSLIRVDDLRHQVHLRPVRPHSHEREDDDRRLAGVDRLEDLPDLVVERAVDLEHRAAGLRISARRDSGRVIRPEVVSGPVALLENGDEELPVRVLQEPAGELAALLHSGEERLADDLGSLGAFLDRDVGLQHVRAEEPLDLLSHFRPVAVEWAQGLRTPVDDLDAVRGPTGKSHLHVQGRDRQAGARERPPERLAVQPAAVHVLQLHGRRIPLDREVLPVVAGLRAGVEGRPHACAHHVGGRAPAGGRSRRRRAAGDWAGTPAGARCSRGPRSRDRS